jgi:two-component system, NtrC family, sensor kinase
MAKESQGRGAVRGPARSSVRRRVVIGLAAIMAAFSLLTIYSIVLHRRTVSDLALINEAYLPLTLGNADIRATQLVFSTLMDRLADDRNQSVTRDWINAARKYRPTTLRRLISELDAQRKRDIPPGEAEYLGRIGVRLADVERRYIENERGFESLYSLMDTGRMDEARVRIERMKRTERALDRVLSRVGEDVRAHITGLAERAQRDGTRATWLLALLTIAALVVGTGVVISASRLLKPLKEMQEAVQKVAHGEIGTHIDIRRDDEIGDLALAFNRMTDALADRDRMLIRSERLATAGKMAAQVTHEIRNPLSSLGLNAELLEEELGEGPDKAEARSLLKAMRDEIERLTGITESYLRFARLPAPEPTMGDLNAAVEAALDFMRGELAEKRTLVTRNLADGLPPLLFDQSQIRQALVNILRNACEAMPGGGRVQVSTRRTGGTVELEVRDTGCGVPREALDHIFDSFYSTKSSGTGLGLPMVRQICLAHGGEARCDDTGPEGSRFVISLPAAGASPPFAPEES